MVDIIFEENMRRDDRGSSECIQILTGVKRSTNSGVSLTVVCDFHITYLARSTNRVAGAPPPSIHSYHPAPAFDEGRRFYQRHI